MKTVHVHVHYTAIVFIIEFFIVIINNDFIINPSVGGGL